MFLVNWLTAASSLQFAEHMPKHCDESPGADFSVSPELSDFQRVKLGRVNHLWRRVVRDVGVDDDEEVRLAFQEGDAETSIAVMHEGTPTIMVPLAYLTDLVVWDADRRVPSEAFDQREWDIWTRVIDQCPDTVEDMAAYAEACKKQISAKKLRRLAGKYGKYLSQIEFEAELAHEMGHIHAKHLTSCRGRRLTSLLRSIALVFVPLAVTVATTAVSLFAQSAAGGLDLIFPLFGGLTIGACVRAFYSRRLLRKSMNFVRRQWEKEADAIAACNPRYCEGNIRLYKRDIFVRLLKEHSVESVGRKIFEDAEHHPSDGSRLRFFLGRMHQHNGAGSEPRCQQFPG